MRHSKVILVVLALAAAARPAQGEWTLVASGTGEDLYVVKSASSGEWFLGDNGAAAKSIDNGLNWTAAPTGTTTGFRGLYMPSSVAYYACGVEGKVLFSGNSGTTWIDRSPTATDETLHAIGARGGSTAYAVGSGGVIFKTTNLAVTWTSQESGTEVTLRAVLGPVSGSSTIMVVAGDGGTILKTTDGGVTWIAMPSGTTEDIQDLCLLSNSVMASGTNGTVLKSTDAGDTWTVLSNGISENLYAIEAGSSTQVTAVGEGGAVFRSTNSGTTWVQQSAPTYSDLLDVIALSANVQIAVGRDGVVIHTDDGGASVVGVEVLPLSENFALASFPNPFVASTTIRYSLGRSLPVRLAVIDVAGREVVTLLDGPATTGNHSLVWDGRDSSGAAVRAGVYFFRMEAGAQVMTGKVLRVE